MIERGDEPDLLRQQHPVAEHIARHVADADHVERLFLDVLAHLAEVPLHRLPRALGGDAHGFVVVPDRAAARECIVEPEAVVARQAVRDVGERRGAFVSRHDEIRVVAIPPHDMRRRDHLVAVEIVRDVEEPF